MAENDDKKKDTKEEEKKKVEYCDHVLNPEMARNSDEDDPCNDGTVADD
jgi:hypothetical protein